MSNIIDTLTGNLNVAGTFTSTYGVVGSVLWEHPDKPGYFIVSQWGQDGLQFGSGASLVAVKFTDLFNLATAKLPALLPALPAVTATPANGAHPQTVTLACAQAAIGGVAIHYTTDGSTPTSGSPLYAAPLNIAAALTLKAIAIATAAPPLWQNSPVASFVYT